MWVPLVCLIMLGNLGYGSGQQQPTTLPTLNSTPRPSFRPTPLPSAIPSVGTLNPVASLRPTSPSAATTTTRPPSPRPTAVISTTGTGTLSFLPCTSECPANPSQCSWFQTCGVGCWCGFIGSSPTPLPGPAPVILWPTMWNGPTSPPVVRVPTVPTPVTGAVTEFPTWNAFQAPTQGPAGGTGTVGAPTMRPTVLTPSALPTPRQTPQPSATQKPTTIAPSVAPTPRPTSKPSQTNYPTNSPPTSSTNASGSTNSNNLPTGALVGIVIGVLVVVGLIFALVCCNKAGDGRRNSRGNRVDLHQFYASNNKANEVYAPGFVPYIGEDGQRRNSRGSRGSIGNMLNADRRRDSIPEGRLSLTPFGGGGGGDGAKRLSLSAGRQSLGGTVEQRASLGEVKPRDRERLSFSSPANRSAPPGMYPL